MKKYLSYGLGVFAVIALIGVGSLIGIARAEVGGSAVGGANLWRLLGNTVSTVTASMNEGVGTTTGNAKLTVQGTAGSTSAFDPLNLASSTGASLFRVDRFGTSTASNGIEILAGCFKVAGTCLTASGGTVTSVSGSGGTTGLTLTGGAITTSGTLTLGGTLVVANGGTGATTFTNNRLLTGNGTGALVDEANLYFDGSFLAIGTTSPASLLHIDAGAATGRVIFDRDAGNPFILSFRTDNVPRWAFRVDGTESGTNTGSDFAVRRYNDAGTYIDSPLTINRSTGTTTVIGIEATNSTSTGKMNIPNGASPSVSVTGDCALDTTSDQLKCFGATATKIYGNGYVYPGFTYSTSTAWTGTTTQPLGIAIKAEDWKGTQCFTNTGTVGISFYDGTNRMDYIATASTTANYFNFTTNNAFTAGEKRYVDIGTPTGSPTKLSCTVEKSLTAN